MNGDDPMLKNYIDIEVLQEIQDKFSKATGLSAVTVDFRGKPITSYSNFSPFCKLMREDERTLKACNQCDAFGGLEAARREKPYIYRCHAGLVDFAIPIIVEGQLLGSIMAGQVKTEPSAWERMDLIVKETSTWKENEKALEAYGKIQMLPYERILSAAEMMFLISNYMIEKNTFLLMQAELDDKNEKLMEHKKERDVLEKALEDSELKALQLQINPHFVFNSLNTAARLALMEKASHTEDTIYTLAEILRYMIMNTGLLVSLKEEISQIERYMNIQRVRFGKRIQFSVNVPDDLQDIQLPSTILQSFVENAIIHGLEPKEGEGTLKVTGFAEDRDLVIEISDNGVGIPKDKLETLLAEKKKPVSGRQSIGICIPDVNMRLSHLYGPEYQVKIDSRIHGGTTVYVRIPIDLRRASHV